MMNYLERIDKYYFLFIALLTIVFVSYSGSYIIEYIAGEDTLNIDFFNDKSLLYIFIFTVIVGPIIETLIFQFGIIELILLLKKNKFFEILAILISSIIFGLTHNYNVYYIIFGVFIGIIFGIIYIVAKRRKDMNAFTIVLIAHAFTNLIAFFHNDVFKLG